jgi:hypothetical protein
VYYLIILLFISLQCWTTSAHAKDEIDNKLDQILAEIDAAPAGSETAAGLDAAVAEVSDESTAEASDEAVTAPCKSCKLCKPCAAKRSRVVAKGKKRQHVAAAQGVKRPRNMNYSINYSVLEKNAPSKFDSDGFHKQRYGELGQFTEQENNQDRIYGGYVCLGENASLLGKVFGSAKNSTLFHEGDNIELAFTNPRSCNLGDRYITLDGDDTGIYKITGVVEITEKALKEGRCVAQVKEIYDFIKRGSNFTDPLKLESAGIASSGSMQVGKVHKLVSQHTIANVGERLCVTFKDSAAPKAGTIVYFYDIKDPVTGLEVDPFLVAKGKLIYSVANYGTALIVSANRPVTKEATVTTRF